MKICVFPLIDAMFKQLQIDILAKRKERTKFIFDSPTTKQSLRCCFSLFDDGKRLKQHRKEHSQ